MAGLNKNDIEQISLLQSVIPPTLYTTHYTFTAATGRAENGIELSANGVFEHLSNGTGHPLTESWFGSGASKSGASPK